jgi:hypothetical protein
MGNWLIIRQGRIPHDAFNGEEEVLEESENSTGERGVEPEPA